MRLKRNNTGLFFDSFKHFKHNLSNLSCYALEVEKYIRLISTNYKSKYPDMRKIGLIEYNKPSDNRFSITQEAQHILEIIEPFTNIYNENILKLARKM